MGDTDNAFIVRLQDFEKKCHVNKSCDQQTYSCDQQTQTMEDWGTPI